MRAALIGVLVLLIAATAGAQTAGEPAPKPDDGQTRLGARWERERRDLGKDCSALKAIGGCAFGLFTSEPLHVSFGSLAPQNGMAFGAAFVDHHALGEGWRLSWSADAVATGGGSWRSGAYVNFARNRQDDIGVGVGDAPAPRRVSARFAEAVPVYATYLQGISLRTLPFYGLGPAPSAALPVTWTMQQTIVGGSAVLPLHATGALGVSLLGALNGRFIETGGSGLADRRGFVEIGQGIRFEPAFVKRLYPEYRLTFHEFLSPGEASFTRLRVDLNHDIALYRTQAAPPALRGNTPNDCRDAPDDALCTSPSKNRYGTLSMRVMTIHEQSIGTATIPFYLQPTLGGSDINGTRRLASYPDYWFRAPNVLSLQASLEHALFDIPLPRGFTIPLGGLLMAEQGQVSTTWDRSLFRDLAHSYSAGLTIRAGGFPEGFALYTWGYQGGRWMVTFNTALLGGGSRPSLD